MLLSMTGFGEARQQNDALAVSVEVRAINNRYFKLNARISEGYQGLESQIEGVVRGQVRRGTVQLNVRVERTGEAGQYRLNEAVLACYCQQLAQFQKRFHHSDIVPIGQLLALPGVVSEQGETGDAAQQWPQIEKVLLEALARLQQMRAKEGAAMELDLTANLDMVATELASIDRRAPLVVEAYRTRLSERITRLLAEYDVLAPESDIITEVGLFAERSDISEEIVRLRSHIEQFRSCMRLEESAGRKLDFVTQEMFRETNTIGSKSSDVEISRSVVEIKTAVERIREMVQNVE